MSPLKLDLGQSSSAFEATKDDIIFGETSDQVPAVLSALDADQEKVGALLNQATQTIENSAAAVTSTLGAKDKRAARVKRELVKKEAKTQRKLKSQEREVLNVIEPETKSISGQAILDLRYSQDSIDSETSDGIDLQELIQRMKDEKRGWKKGTALTVVRMPDGQLTSMDNRRLYAAKKVTEEKPVFEIKIFIYNHDDKAPKKMLTGVITEYKIARRLNNINELAQGILEETYGHCAKLRMHTRNGDLNSGNFGYTNPPIIRQSEETEDK